MNELRKRMLEDLRLGGYRKATIESYVVESVAAFARYHKKSPALCDPEDVRNGRCICSRTAGRLGVSALTTMGWFFYSRTLGRPEVVAGLPLPKVRKSMPLVLSASEVQALLETWSAPDADVLHARLCDGTALARGMCP